MRRCSVQYTELRRHCVCNIHERHERCRPQVCVCVCVRIEEIDWIFIFRTTDPCLNNQRIYVATKSHKHWGCAGLTLEVKDRRIPFVPGYWKAPHKYSTCTVYVLSYRIHINTLPAGVQCCFEMSKQSSEGHWNKAPRDPPFPIRLGLHAYGKYENFSTFGARHEDSDNETQINSPLFDLWKA